MFRSRFLACLVLTGFAMGCGSSTNGSTGLTGTWTGSDHRSDGTVFTSTVTLSQNGSSVTGSDVVTFSGTQEYTGQISGTFTSPTYTFTITVAAGAVAGQPTCSFDFAGTGTLASSSASATTPSQTLSGAYAGTGSSGCLDPIVSDTFTWTLQGS